MRPALRHSRRIVQAESAIPRASIPTFLCPILLRTPVPNKQHPQRSTFSTFKCARLDAATASIHNVEGHSLIPPQEEPAPPPPPSALPLSCPGCGAPSQVVHKGEAGYYDIDRKAVYKYLNHTPARVQEEDKEEDVYQQALQQVDPRVLEELGVDGSALEAPSAAPKAKEQAPTTPVCDRCHILIHHHSAVPIHHPSIDSIYETIRESPHRRNHIYHVLDAADFPLSLVSNLSSALKIPQLRTHNRRAKHKGWVANDRIAEVSFIITRADLLAPLKEQVDKLLPYMQDVLRTALGRANKNARLGNIRLVSAKRGWWTKQIKEEIWARGGAGWMVGRVNVGKSNLFENVYPKGRGGDAPDVRKMRSAAEREAMLQAAKSLEELTQVQKQLADEDADAARQPALPNQTSASQETPDPEQEPQRYDPGTLLPPPQPYTDYPVLPLISSLPGTTASPIRIPFGRDRGELIDLPGLARTSPDLTTFVKPEFHEDLVMTQRIVGHQHTLKPGQSLVLGGGLIRITPVTEDLTFLVHPFVPLEPHVTATAKAEGFQSQSRETGLQSILAEDVGDKMKSAGRFKLKWDVTKKLAGPLTSPVAGKMKPENLPFQIWSTDILIEGVGWVEIVAQRRRPQGWKPVGLVKKDPNHARLAKEAALRERQKQRETKYSGKRENDAFDDAGFADRWAEEMLADYPEVEVFSPLGKYVGSRMPMSASMLGGPKRVAKRDRKVRPRRSMVSVKQQRKPMERS